MQSMKRYISYHAGVHAIHLGPNVGKATHSIE